MKKPWDMSIEELEEAIHRDNCLRSDVCDYKYSMSKDERKRYESWLRSKKMMEKFRWH